MHASVNNTTGIVPAAVPHAVDPMSFQGSLVAWVTVGVSWGVAALLLLRMRGAETRAMLSSEARQFSPGEVSRRPAPQLQVPSPDPLTHSLARRFAGRSIRVARLLSLARLLVRGRRARYRLFGISQASSSPD